MPLSRGRSLLAFITLGSFCLVPNLAHGWGAVGHRIVARVGSTLAGNFWAANSTGMVTLTTAPDAVYKRLPTANVEKPTHFFQPDSYFEDPSQFKNIPLRYLDAVNKFGGPFVTKNGTAPWRTRQYYDLAVAAIKAGDFRLGLEYASIMSHYIGDMSQPLHDTKNYDGQETDQKGIHGFFESTNIQNADLETITNAVGKAANALLHDPNFRNQFKGTVNAVTFNEVMRAYSYKDPLLALDEKYGRQGAGASRLLKLAIARMADGAASLTLILTHLWADAGNPSGGGTVDVQVPKWQAPEYENQLALLQSRTNLMMMSTLDDDCQ